MGFSRTLHFAKNRNHPHRFEILATDGRVNEAVAWSIRSGLATTNVSLNGIAIALTSSTENYMIGSPSNEETVLTKIVGGVGPFIILAKVFFFLSAYLDSN